MVVDDEPAICQMLACFLGKTKYMAICFTNPIEALAYLKSNSTGRDCRAPRCDIGGLAMTSLRGRETTEAISTSNGVALLLTDLDMPEINGLELARQAKRLYPTLPIIVMSGSADGQDRDAIFALGADFIPKPFELDDLLKRIETPLLIAGR